MRRSKQTGEEHDVLLSVHAPYYINLNANADEWPKSRQRLMDAAHYGNLAGATEIIFHPGSYFGNPPEEVLPTAIERLAGCRGRIAARQITRSPCGRRRWANQPCWDHYLIHWR